MCFDPIDDVLLLKERTYEICERVGMFNHKDALANFQTFIETIIDKADPDCLDLDFKGFEWSDYLAFSAAQHLDTFDTLPVHPA